MSNELLEAYRSLLQSLWDRVAVMLGRITTRTLVERALFETAKEYPLVQELILQEHCLDLSNLERKSDQISVQELRDSMNALVVSIVGVLAEQVGRSIADQIAKKAVIPVEERGR